MSKQLAKWVTSLTLFCLLIVTTVRSSASDKVWSDDSVPAGAAELSDGIDSWNWTTSNPAPVSGAVAHQSSLSSGLHQHYFNYATAPHAVENGDVLFTYVYLDPANVPSQIMVSWHTDAEGWEHRAYWGTNQIDYGTDGTVSRHYMGALPAAGQWVRLEVPASVLGLDGATLTGMGFSLFDGQATWDKSGTAAPAPARAAAPSTTEVVWFDDAVPEGAAAMAAGGDTWNWSASSPAPVSGAVAHVSNLAAGQHEHYFNYAGTTLSVGAGEILFAYIYLDPATPPSEIMLSWNGDGWEHRAYWGANLINYGTDGTNGRRYMGALPAAGQWVRLEVPASAVGLEGQTLTGMGFTLFDGQATWDKTGKALPASATPTPTPPTTASVIEAVWSDDTVPEGAVQLTDNRDTWNWTSSPAPVSGALAHQSTLAAGLHEHFFNYASAPLTVGAGDVLFTYVYLNAATPPSQVMLAWNAGGWEHRAYWGANSINYGTDGSASRRYMGALPAAGQWVRLEVPASQVGLEGATITGMGFSLFDGQATWDKTGKANAATTTPPAVTPPVVTPPVVTPPVVVPPPVVVTPPPVVTPPVVVAPPVVTPPATTTPGTNTGGTPTYTGGRNIDGTSLTLAKPGESLLHILTPTVLELKFIDTKPAGNGALNTWNFVSTSGSGAAPSASKFNVTIEGQTVGVQSVGFKRRVISAPLVEYDLRVENSIYLVLSGSVSDGQFVQVTNADGSLFTAAMKFQAICEPQRYSPAIHVNQEGYVPSFPKKAMVGYYLGDMGEMSVSATSFAIIDARSGAVAYRGSLSVRQDEGYNISPAPYQKVLQADFSDFKTPGEYQLQVAGLGASLPFVINEGIAMGFARTYALGLYHQRCGMSNEMPYTRCNHAACHTARAQVPVQSDPQFAFTWATIAAYGGEAGADNPTQIAPKLTSESAQLYPFVNQGTVDVSGGHHDAGDYSKYTINSAELIHYLMFSVDTMPGVAAMDNLGLPESGDGISDVLQEAKIEADYIAKLQDADGGFYFLTYPKNREYESGTQPDQGDSQVVWPKNTSVTAAAVAALAECASSPLMKKHYPAAAAKYLQQAQAGWQFLMRAIAKYGKAGAYQKITFYSDHYTHDDELAWAATEMFLATGDAQYHQKMKEWFPNPSDSATFRWGWWRMSECWGNAVRSYAFAARSGRIAQGSLDAAYLANCESQVVAAGDDALDWSKKNAYATPFPIATKRVRGAGWYFSLDQASDMAVAYLITPKPAYLDALVGAMNYEGGTNPVNVTYLTGLGLKRQREIVDQNSQSDRRVLPRTGIPLGNIQAGFAYLQKYGSELSNLSYPSDNATTAPYPFYDRWSDTFNVTTEYIAVNQARGMLATSFLAAQTAGSTGAWKSATAQITVPTTTVLLDAPVTLTVQVPGMDIGTARIVWEARDQEPAFGSTYTISPKSNGAQWVEVEIEWPDGRRAFGVATFQANSPVVKWIAGALPLGANPGTDGDTWAFSATDNSPTTVALSHESKAKAGLHLHWFSDATATLDVSAGDSLFAWVYLDPANAPKEIMLMWNDGSGWEHRAYWGTDSISYGSAGTAGRYNMGALPPTGQWVKLSVPASAVGLEGKVVSGMGFALFDGRAIWNAAGKASAGN